MVLKIVFKKFYNERFDFYIGILSLFYDYLYIV